MDKVIQKNNIAKVAAGLALSVVGCLYSLCAHAAVSYTTATVPSLTACNPNGTDPVSGAVFNHCAVISESGADQFIVPGPSTIPVGVHVMAYLWGAAGGTGADISNGAAIGGVGGFSTGEFTVPNTTLAFVVGQGGGGNYTSANPAPYGGGGAGGSKGSYSYYGAAGGGLSGIFLNSTPYASTSATAVPIIIAGGGGGGETTNWAGIAGNGGGLTGGGGNASV